MFNRREFLTALGVSAAIVALPPATTEEDAVAQAEAAGLDPHEVVFGGLYDHNGDPVEAPLWFAFSDNPRHQSYFLQRTPRVS